MKTNTEKFYNIIKIAYQPAFSHKTKRHIKENLEPELESDGTCQYDLDFVLDCLDNSILSETDNKIFAALEKDEIDYIEL